MRRSAGQGGSDDQDPGSGDQDLDTGSFPHPFGESDELGPDELAAAQAAAAGQSQEGEGDDEGADGGDELAQLREQLEQERRDKTNLERRLGEQGQELGFYRQHFRGGGAQPPPGGQSGYGGGAGLGMGFPQGQFGQQDLGGQQFGQDAYGGGAPVDPLVVGMQQYLATGDPRHLQAASAAMQQQIQQQMRVGAYAVVNYMEQRREVERQTAEAERKFFRDNPHFAEGVGAEVFEGKRAELKVTSPQMPVADQLAEAGKRTDAFLKAQGFKLMDESEAAAGAARERQGAPGSGARGPEQGTPLTQRQIAEQSTAQYVKSERERAARSQASAR